VEPELRKNLKHILETQGYVLEETHAGESVLLFRKGENFVMVSSW
jgi:hypothetical protein